MTVPGNLLDSVESVVNDCRVHHLSTDLTTVDGIVLNLECCTQNLCNYISTIARCSAEYNLLRELNECISYTLVEWEAKLQSIESNEGAHYGRPRKLVNIELVSDYIIMLHRLLTYCFN